MAVMGRPKSDNPRKWSVTVRLTEKEYQEICQYATDHEQTVTKTLLDGFSLLLKQQERST